MLKVKAKFNCNSVTETVHNKKASFNAVYSTTGENADFAKATPWGTLEIMIDKDSPAANAFEPGKDYYLTFEPVEG